MKWIFFSHAVQLAPHQRWPSENSVSERRMGWRRLYACLGRGYMVQTAQFSSGVGGSNTGLVPICIWMRDSVDEIRTYHRYTLD